eukprot:CAMPEP_0185841492 /NCGR_PEP_ID=MMETSP1353-20130828/17922_1 /TAXON_ID=1077150 /ORGANISM="Erythrolobus australicus, Strain CCMP3124" /LENGTH=654 /DNA_ID=CAMNT_0028540971 /DNA_START=37 /DNA_END=1998 /DNA_ORIENTATION=+
MADEVREVRRMSGHYFVVQSVVFSTDGKWLATGSRDRTVKLWNAATGEYVRTCSGHSDYVRSVAFSHDGKRVASGSDDNTVRVWDTASGRCVRTCSGHSNWVWAVAISSDDKWLASGSSDNSVRLWNPSTGEYLRTCTGHSKRVNALAFSPDGALLASGSADYSVRLWNPAGGAIVRACEGHSAGVYAVAFAKSGKVLASGSEDKTMRLWDAASGACLRTFAGHSDTVYSVAFSPDGKWLASGSSDKTVRLWDVESGVCMRIIEGHSEWVNSVAFSTDGNWLASGSGDQTARLWDTSSLKWGEKEKVGAHFFTCLAECDELELDAYKALEKLQSLVTGVSEFKLFYTFASAAMRNGDISAKQRKQFVCNVLDSIRTNFKFDQRSEVMAILTRTVLPACEREGFIDVMERERLTHEFTRGNVFADYQYQELKETVALQSRQIEAVGSVVNEAHKRINNVVEYALAVNRRVDEVNGRVNRIAEYASAVNRRVDGIAEYVAAVNQRVDQVADYAQAVNRRVDGVVEYAAAVDHQLQEFKSLYRRHLQRKAAIGTVSGLVSLIPAFGAGLGKMFDNVVDLSSVAEVFTVAVEAVGGHERIVEMIEDKGGKWAELPLKKAVREHRLRAPEVAALGMIQIMDAMDDGRALRELEGMFAQR